MTDSRIKQSRARVLRAEARDGIAMSFGSLARRSMVLVELTDETGLIGRGESWVNFPSWAAAERVATLTEGVFPLLAAQDAERVAATQNALFDKLVPLGQQWGAPGPIAQAISAVDVALWDLLGQRGDRSVSALGAGRMRDEIGVYASSLGPSGVPALASACRDAGFRAVKVKLGFGRAVDDANLAAVRKACGPGMELYADANQAWTLEEAAAMAPVLREYGVEWIEEPVRGDRLADLERLYERTGLRIATGENIYGKGAFLPYAQSPAVAVLQPDVAKTGGLTEALAVCAVAEACGKQVAPHLYSGAPAFLATLQLAAMSRAVYTMEYDVRDNPLRDPLLIDPPRPHDGRIVIPDGPGLGVAFNLDAVERYTEVAA